MQDDDLAYFQSELLNRLAEELPPEEIRQRLLADQRLLPFADYIRSFEPKMLDVAVVLVKKWGRRTK
jgi:hypothetical protein